VKMSDVARLANVSTATVSRVLSNPEVVNEETRRKVLEVIEKVNYKPHIVARQFRTQETRIILVVVPDITSGFFSEVLRGIEHVALSKGYQVILGDTENEIQRERSYINLLHQKQADGMVLLTARISKEELDLISRDFPVVLACEYMDGLNIPTVSIDNISSARKATEHLIELGHTKIAHISGPMDVILSRDRLRGFRQALFSYELPVDPAYIQEGDLTYDSGYNLTLKMLAMEKPPTGIFVFNDEMAMGVIKATENSGFHVPRDLAVVGFDNIKMSTFIDPALTTINQPKYDIGKKAMNLLLKRINGEKLDKIQYILSDELLIRDSCGAKTKHFRKIKEKRGLTV
jgi:LacI family repressor for deo operon, udp, cdd, tsx, nupC, and nupG